MLDVSRLAGIVDYEPAELILTARAGDADGRDRGAAGGKAADAGLRAAGLARPLGGGGRADARRRSRLQSRRIRAGCAPGAARDYFLGFSAINGWGEIWKAGGKVVKNVTGYDMCKLQAGAYGTLSVLAEVTLKVMPRPETACTILLQSMADEVAIRRTVAGAEHALEVSAAAHLPAAVARRSGVAAVAEGLGAVTALRLEGPAPSVAFRAKAIEVSVRTWAPPGRRPRSARLWAEIGQVRAFAAKPARVHLATVPDANLAPARRSTILRARFASAEALLRLGRRPGLAEPRRRAKRGRTAARRRCGPR